MRRRIGARTALGLIPPILLIIGMLLPAVNGPHLWLGLPALLLWVAGCAVTVTVVLVLIEKLRPETGDGE